MVRIGGKRELACDGYTDVVEDAKERLKIATIVGALVSLPIPARQDNKIHQHFLKLSETGLGWGLASRLMYTK